MTKIVVCDPIAEGGLALLREAGEVVTAYGLTRDELADAIAGADAVVVRSATRLDAELIGAAERLKVIARAGVGVDNIDVEAATRRGIAVVNAPTGNTVAAAEHAMALLLAAVRRVPLADAALKAGRWAKKEALGRQLYGKTLGIVGLGKIGSEVAKRARAFGMKLLAYDPYIPAEKAEEVGAQPVELNELLGQSDFVSLHAALTDESRHLIGAEQLARMRPSAVLVNSARGGMVDEKALLEALRSGRLGGAALDVFEDEPQPDPALVGLDNVVATPHVAASTEEAQGEVAMEAAQQVVDVLAGRPPRWPVNVPAHAPEDLDLVRPFLELAEKLGRLQAALLRGAPRSLDLDHRGSLSRQQLRVVSGYCLVGLLSRIVDEPINHVNSALIAQERGIRVREGVVPDLGGYSEFVRVSVGEEDATTTVAGAVLDRGDARIVEVARFGLDLAPRNLVVLVWNREPDRPGFVGTIGQVLGAANINILGIQVGHEVADSEGLMAVTVAEPVAAEVLDTVAGLPGVARTVTVDFGGWERETSETGRQVTALR